MTDQPQRTESTTMDDLSAQLFSAARADRLPRPALEKALSYIGYRPSRTAWASFLNNLFLYLGALLLVSGIFFFFAYNWDDLHHFAKFGLIQAGIVAAAGVAHYLGLHKLSGKVSLTVAALLVGVLLAVYGQFYQTGADSYLLFLLWSLLIAGWVFISRFQPLWLVLIALCNVALLLYLEQTQRLADDEFYQIAEILFLMNAGFLLIWELMRGRIMEWMTNRILPNVVGLVALVAITIPVATTIMSIGRSYLPFDELHALITAILYAAAVTGIFVFYGRFKHDLFMLAIAMFSLIGLATTGLVRLLDSVNFDSSLMMILTGLVVVGLTALAINILQRISSSWETAI